MDEAIHVAHPSGTFVRPPSSVPLIFRFHGSRVLIVLHVHLHRVLVLGHHFSREVKANRAVVVCTLPLDLGGLWLGGIVPQTHGPLKVIQRALWL